MVQICRSCGSDTRSGGHALLDDPAIKGQQRHIRISPMLYGLWSALSLWIALDAAN